MPSVFFSLVARPSSCWFRVIIWYWPVKKTWFLPCWKSLPHSFYFSNLNCSLHFKYHLLRPVDPSTYQSQFLLVTVPKVCPMFPLNHISSISLCAVMMAHSHYSRLLNIVSIGPFTLQTLPSVALLSPADCGVVSHKISTPLPHNILGCKLERLTHYHWIKRPQLKHRLITAI